MFRRLKSNSQSLPNRPCVQISRSPSFRVESIPEFIEVFAQYEHERSQLSIFQVFRKFDETKKMSSDFLNQNLDFTSFLAQTVTLIVEMNHQTFFSSYCSTAQPFIQILYIIVLKRPDLFTTKTAQKLTNYLITCLPEIYEGKAEIAIDPHYSFLEKIQLIPTIVKDTDNSQPAAVLWFVTQIVALFAKAQIINTDNLIFTNFPTQHVDAFIDYYCLVLENYNNVPVEIMDMIKRWGVEAEAEELKNDVKESEKYEKEHINVFKIENDPNGKMGSFDSDIKLLGKPIVSSLENVFKMDEDVQKTPTPKIFKMVNKRAITVNQVMRFQTMLSYLFPNEIFSGNFFPWNTKCPIEIEVLLYYFNYVTFSSDKSFVARLVQFYKMMQKAPVTLTNAFEFCMTKLLCASHKRHANCDLLSPLLDILDKANTESANNILTVAFCSIVHLNEKEIVVLTNLLKCPKYATQLYAIISTQLSLMQSSEIYNLFVVNGLSFTLRSHINTNDILEYLTFMLKLFVSAPLTQDFLVSEPRNFICKIVAYSNISKETYDLIVSFLTTGVLQTKMTNSHEKMDFTYFTKSLSLLTPPKEMSKIAHNLAVLKIYSLMSDNLNKNDLEYYYQFIESNLLVDIGDDNLSTLKEFYTVLLLSFETFKTHKIFKPKIIELFLKKSTLQKLKNIYDKIGVCVFNHLRNLSLDKSCVIDNVLFLEVYVTLLDLVDTVEKPFSELLPLLENPLNVDILSHSNLIIPLLALANTNTPVNSIYYFLQVVVNYNCDPTFFLKFLKDIHANGLSEKQRDLIVDCTHCTLKPRNVIEVSKLCANTVEFKIDSPNSQSLGITFWLSMTNYADYSKDGLVNIFSLKWRDAVFTFSVSSIAILVEIRQNDKVDPVEFGFSFRLKVFSHISINMKQTKSLEVQIAVDGKFLSGFEPLEMCPLAFFPFQITMEQTNNASYRMGNINFFKDTLNEEVIKAMVTTRPDVLPSDWGTEPPINFPLVTQNFDYFASALLSAKKVYYNDTKKFEEITVKSPNAHFAFECVGMKEALNMTGGIEVLLLLLAEVKTTTDALEVIEVIRKYISKNRVAAQKCREIHFGRILTDILSYTTYEKQNSIGGGLPYNEKLTENIGIVKSLVNLCSNQDESPNVIDLYIETGELMKSIFFCPPFWMRTSNDVFEEYLKTIKTFLVGEFAQHNMIVLRENGCIAAFVQYVPLVIGTNSVSVLNLFLEVIQCFVKTPLWSEVSEMLKPILCRFCGKTPHFPHAEFFGQRLVENEKDGEKKEKRNLMKNSHSENNLLSPRENGKVTGPILFLELLKIVVKELFKMVSSDETLEYLNTLKKCYSETYLVNLIYHCTTAEELINVIQLLHSYIANNIVSVTTMSQLFPNLLGGIKSEKVLKIMNTDILSVLWDLSISVECEEYVLMIGSLEGINVEFVISLLKKAKHLEVSRKNEKVQILTWNCLVNITDVYYCSNVNTPVLLQNIDLMIETFGSLGLDPNMTCLKLSSLCLYTRLSAVRWAFYLNMSVRYKHVLFPSIAIIKLFTYLVELNVDLTTALPKNVLQIVDRKFSIKETMLTIKDYNVSGMPIALYYSFLVFGAFSEYLKDFENDSLQLVEETVNTLPNINEFPIVHPLSQLMKKFENKGELIQFMEKSTGDVEESIKWLMTSCEIFPPEPLPHVKVSPIKIESDIIDINNSFYQSELTETVDTVAVMAWRKMVRKYTTKDAIFEYDFSAPYSFIKLENTLCNGNSQMILSKTTPKFSSLPIEEHCCDPKKEEEKLKKYDNLVERVRFKMFDEVEAKYLVEFLKYDKDYPAIVYFKDYKEDTLGYSNTSTITNTRYLVVRFNKGGDKNMTSRECRELCIDVEDITSVHRMSVLYEDTALEIFHFYSLKSFILQFKSSTERSEFLSQLPIVPNEAQRFEEKTKLWEKGMLSNYDFLYEVNRYANRTFLLLYQYPIYPWVTSEFSNNFRVNDIRSYRNLEFPISLIDEKSRETSKRKLHESFDEKGYNYSCYLSSQSLVCRSMIRLQPFAGMLWTEMSERCFEVGGRVFKSVENLFESSVEQSRSELIPQYYTTPTFLQNINKFLTKGADKGGKSLGDVELPKWKVSGLRESAKDYVSVTPREFTEKMRQSLESGLVSTDLNLWIDLVFGSSQQSSTNFNVFSPDFTERSEKDDILKKHFWKTMGILPKQVKAKSFSKRVVKSSRDKSCSLLLSAATRQPKKYREYTNAYFLVPEKNGVFAITKRICSLSGNNVIWYEENTHRIMKNSDVLKVLVGVRCLHSEEDYIITGGDCVVGMRKWHVQQFVGLSDVSAISVSVYFDTAIGGNEFGEVVTWSILTEKIRWKKDVKFPVRHVVISGNGDTFIVTFDKETEISYITGFDINGEVFGEFNINAKITACAVTKSKNGVGNVLVIGTNVGEVIIFDAQNMGMVSSYSADRSAGEVTSFLFTENECKVFYCVQSKGKNAIVYCL
ncbi:alcohol dehydrogenase, putative [Entamoeba invadens IP1]|uniref:alcohol dehydrogenase, putative n=1 Tax=Entamoeba invadens IP1 TaxID=370355 RepID=UPI0002C3FA3A|nr:alcohol dehydrogenase, putative [Entamoeba invadens IP1]ELP90565.1 alcohol dehydrogenase, putative [Entamoeba invadens IP1]|eukprot:XP_004257336.1 alcohol dehydrogenase, putative [Entamoeba invadens IP1]